MGDIQPTEAEKEQATINAAVNEIGLLFDDHMYGFRSEVYRVVAKYRDDAVKAERERCRDKINALDAKLPAFRRSTYQEGYGDAISDAEQAILSDDQEARNG